jgi:hypothetical protein
MYYVLFTAIADALDALDHLDIGTAKEILRGAHCCTEEIYISQGDRDAAQEEEDAKE